MSDQTPNPARRPITLKDVAAKAGVSVATVSLALRNHPRLSEATTKRVKKLADHMGYTPDPALSALAAHRSRIRVYRDFSVIGLVSNWSTKDAWAGIPSARQVIAGASTRARELGYSLQHLWARKGGATPARFDQILKARGIRGLILAPFEKADAHFPLDWKSYSVVTIERAAHYTHFHHVVPNHYEDLLLCWAQLRQRGYTRVGLVVRGDLAVRWSHQWEAAHSFAQTQITAPLGFVPTLELKESRQIEQIRSWLREHRPQAVINRSEHFLEAAEQEGLRVPEDIGYVSLNVIDDISAASGIDQHREIIGATAVDVLNSLLQRNHRGFQPVSLGTLVDGSWRPGRTLPKKPPVIRRSSAKA